MLRRRAEPRPSGPVATLDPLPLKLAGPAKKNCGTGRRRLGLSTIGFRYDESVTASLLTVLTTPVFILWCDWIGSLLMIGTAWSWLYRKLSVGFEHRTRISDKKLAACRRLWRHRGIVAAFEHRRRYWSEQGVSPEWPLATRLTALGKLIAARHRQIRAGTLPPAATEAFESAHQAHRRAVRLALQLTPVTIRLVAARSLLYLSRALTEEVLTGRTATFLFGLGLLLWNLSKVAALVALTHGRPQP